MEELSVYFEDKVIKFVPAGTSAHAAALLDPDGLSIAKVVQKLENRKEAYVVCDDCREVFDRFCNLFRIARAAGGVVENVKGEVLFIRRNGRWDLPKGHCEEGESLARCAEREVGEECGIDGAVCVKALTRTRHTYKLDGDWILKDCTWFRMRYEGFGQPSPQTQEGIDRAIWAAPERFGELSSASYQTIRNVINCYTR